MQIFFWNEEKWGISVFILNTVKKFENFFFAVIQVLYYC